MHSKKNYAKHIRKWLNCEWERLGKGKVDGKVHPFTGDMLLRSPRSELFLPYLCALLICILAYDFFGSDYVLYQFHTKKMDATVVFLFAGTLMPCL